MVKHITLEHQLVDLLTKPLDRTKVNFICDKLGIYNICPSLKESVERYSIY